MLPKQHLIFGIIFSAILLIIFPKIGWIGFFIIILSTVLIDVDHYLYFVYKKKNLNLKNAFNWFIENGKKFSSLPKIERDKFYLGFCVLHGIEILFILFILGMFISKYFLFILVGFSFHLFLDVTCQISQRKRITKVSLVHDFLKFKKLKLMDVNGRT
ncbi:hypothetical protein KAR52_00445 [Candidatus Pacearchaeota archaeon]|nr:hypothetical protein [Candidatus Pacearchaeota archaeon]